MKDLAEAAVGMAYSSLLFNNRSLAAEVGALEARSDQLHDELESWVLRASPEARDPDELRGLLRLAAASEAMCDAARDMTWYVEHGEPLHPVVQMALEETEETSAQTVVQLGSPAAGALAKELRLETETGMFVLAVQRGARWIYRPRPGFVLREGRPPDLGRPGGGRGGALGADRCAHRGGGVTRGGAARAGSLYRARA